MHRDIKPSNLMLDARGNIWVTDFGLAKFLEGEDASRSENIAGTLRFMSPERFQGVSGPSADVYALGATLYEMLTLRPVFAGKDRLHLIHRIVNETPVAPRTIDPKIPPDLEAIVQKALAKDPTDRFRTAEELRKELELFCKNLPARTRPLSTPVRFGRWCKRNPGLAAASTTAAMLGIALAIGSMIAAWTYRGQRDEIENQSQHLKLDVSDLEQANRKARLKQFEAHVAQARAERFTGRQGQRFEGLRAINEAGALLDGLGFSQEERDRRQLELRNLAIACLALPDFRYTGRWSAPEEAVGVALSQDHQRLAWWDAKNNLVVQRTADGVVIERLPGEGTTWLGTFVNASADFLVGRNNRDMCLWTPGKAFPTRTWHTKAPLRRVIQSADGRYLVLGTGPEHLEVYEIATGRLVNTFEMLPQTAESGAIRLTIVFSPDGRWMAMNFGKYLYPDRNTVRVFELETGRLLPLLQHSESVFGLAWYPDSKTLATSLNSGQVIIWDLADGQPRRVGPIPGPTEGAPNIAIDPACQVLACAAHWGAQGLRVFDPRTGRVLFQMPGHIESLEAGAVFADGNLRGSTRNGREIVGYELVPGREYRSLARRPMVDGVIFGSVSVHPGGRVLAAGNEQGVVFLDLETGDDVGFVPIGASDVWFEPISGALWTSTRRTGVSRWPVEVTKEDCRVGLPERRLRSGHPDNRVRGSRDGRVVAAGRSKGTVVLQADPEARPFSLMQRDVRHLAVSPDGRWIATCTHVGAETRVWDATSWTVVRKFAGNPQFSPDGRWLLAMDSKQVWRLWEVGTWKPGPAVIGPRGAAAFSADSSMLALESGRGTIFLIATATGRELATLDGPTQDVAASITFSPDGSRLIAAGNGNPSSVHVWDLRLIRRELAEMKLDWGAPTIPDAHSAADRLKVDIVGTTPSNLGRVADEAIRDAESTLARHPKTGDEGLETLAADCNRLAWELATGPARARDPARALTLARRAVDLVPGKQLSLKSLGVALYRSGRCAEVVPVLEKSLAVGQGEFDAYDLFFLAMARHRLGDRIAARADFDRALKWLKDHPNLDSPYVTELSGFRAEAEAELAGPTGEMPANVFAP